MSTTTKTTTRRCACARCRAHDRGVAGPFSPAEFLELHGGIVEPEAAPVNEELVALEEALRSAEVEYDAATRAWGRALQEAAEHDRERPAGQRAEASGERVRAAVEARGEAEARLEHARGAYHEAARRETTARAAAEYAADLEQQAAKRAAAAARRREHRTGLLTRLTGRG